MATPPTAFTWPQAMDPADLIDFEADLTGNTVPLSASEEPLLNTGEDVASFTLSMSPEGTALGLTISAQLGYAPTLDNGVIRLWLYVEEALRENAAFAGAGVSIPITLTVTTNSTPARRRQRTLVVKVAQL